MVSCWYLATLGIRPEHQGRGLVTAVMAPVHARCDAEVTSALTETPPENVAFSTRMGFEVLRNLTLPVEGPSLWITWREPKLAPGTDPGGR